GTDDRAARPRGNIDVESLEDLAAGIVAEAEIVEADGAAADGERRSARFVDDLGRSVEQVPHRFHVDQALAYRAVDPAEHVQRTEELHQQAVDPNHVAGGEAAVAPSPDGEDHRPGHHQISDQRLADIEPSQADLIADRRAGKGADRFLVAPRLTV